MEEKGALRLDQPAAYTIRVQGWIGERWADWVNGMALSRHGDENVPVTTLTGTVADQPALLGLLMKLNNLGFVLLEVMRTGASDLSPPCAG